MTHHERVQQRIRAHKHILSAQEQYDKGYISLAKLITARKVARAVLDTVKKDVLYHL